LIVFGSKNAGVGGGVWGDWDDCGERGD
jgi:hypothetical protein